MATIITPVKSKAAIDEEKKRLAGPSGKVVVKGTTVGSTPRKVNMKGDFKRSVTRPMEYAMDMDGRVEVYSKMQFNCDYATDTTVYAHKATDITANGIVVGNSRLISFKLDKYDVSTKSALNSLTKAFTSKIKEHIDEEDIPASVLIKCNLTPRDDSDDASKSFSFASMSDDNLLGLHVEEKENIYHVVRDTMKAFGTQFPKKGSYNLVVYANFVQMRVRENTKLVPVMVDYSSRK